MTILQHSIAQAAAAAGGYQIARSLRFNRGDSPYLNRTFTSAGNRKIWTFSAWLKKASNANADDLYIFSSNTTAGSSADVTFIRMPLTTDTLQFLNAASGTNNVNLITNAVFRDLSGWFHVNIAVDTTQATAANRIKISINGAQITSFSPATYPAQNTDLNANGAILHNIGRESARSVSYFNGYMADIRFIDGQALDPTSFGEFDANTGVWNPKTYSGTYGTNGFWLKFDDNSNNTATTLGKDSSGNGNNWTPNNLLVTAGAGNDSLVDSPTNYGTDTGVGGEVRGNYCTLNPLDRGSDWLTVTNGNLDATFIGPTGHSIRSTMAVSSGKWYWEFTNVNNLSTGIIRSELPIVPATGSKWPGSDGFGVNNSYGYFSTTGNKYNNATATAYGATFTTTDVIGVALDMDNGKIYWSKNGTWQASGDPAAGTNAAFTGISGTFSPAWGYIGAGAGTITVNFGQRAFAYTAPSGFKALCTQNLPTPAIGATSSTLASKNFNTLLYTGNATARSIAGLGFQPDLLWIKDRSSGTLTHILSDSVRGATKQSFTPLTNGEEARTDRITAFNSDGFSLGTYTDVNTNADAFVAWAWKGANASVSNTAGSITSTVSANPAAGISIATYTGNGSAVTIGHGLSAAPKLVIVKRRDNVSDWAVYHHKLPDASYFLYLNSTAAQGVFSGFWNNTAPTSSVVSIGGTLSASGGSYVAYSFAEVDGFSKFGTYTGNGATDGPFVYCGFRPKFIMIKRIDSTGSWQLFDSVRGTYNVNKPVVFSNASDAEASDDNRILDFLSNGVKIRQGAPVTGEFNASGGTYVFAAFAEAPFNYARAR